MLFASCSSGDTPVGDGQAETEESLDPAVVADSNVPDPAEYATNGSIPEEPGFVQADANTATTEQLVAAFEANGIDDPTTRAEQVIAHRPYVADGQFGQEFDALRLALVDAGLDDFAVEAIVASLSVTR
jgi:hypothetical protein